MENTKNEKNSIEQEEAQSIAENSVISTRSYNAAKYQ